MDATLTQAALGAAVGQAGFGEEFDEKQPVMGRCRFNARLGRHLGRLRR